MGRVGALAVALGIGVAVATHPGVVLASPGVGAESPNDTSSSESAGSDEAAAPADDQAAETVQADDVSNDDDEAALDADDPADDADSEDDTEPGDPVEQDPAVSGSNVDSGREGRRDGHHDTEAPDVDTERAIDIEADESDAVAPAPGPRRVATTARTQSDVSVPSGDAVAVRRTAIPTPVSGDAPMALAPAAVVTTPVVSLTSGLFSLFGIGALSNSTPAPVNSSPLLALFAWVRRQLFNTTPMISRTGPDITDSLGNVEVTLRETDADGDRLVYSAISATKGIVTLNPDGYSFTYDPNAGATGTDTFTVRVTDRTYAHSHGLFGFLRPGGGHTASQVITVTIPAVGPVNQAPVRSGAPTVGTPDNGGVVTGELKIVDPEGAPLKYLVTTDPIYGTVIVDEATGVYTYTPRVDARLLAALSTTTVEKDGFVISVSDLLNAPVSVTVANVLVAELVSNSVIATPEVGQGPRAVAISPDGTYAYVANTDDDSISVLNLVTGETVTTITGVGDSPVAIAVSADGTRVYTANSTGRSVGVIENNIVVDIIDINAAPTGVAVSPGGAFVYTTNTNSTITIITVANRSQAVIPVDPSSIVFNSAGTVAYALNSVDEVVTVLDTSGGPNNGAVLGTIEVGAEPSGIAIHPGGAYVYVTNTGDDTVTIIRTADNTVLRTVDVGDQPHGIDITPDGTRLYVANFGSDTISIINTSTYAVTDIAVSNGPFGIDIDASGTRATVTHIDDAIVTVLLLAGNSAPETDVAVVGRTAAGVVLGTFGATDDDGDPLSYRVTATPARGSVALDGQGGYAFTPLAGAGSAAAATPGRDFDMFSVEISDGRGGIIERTVAIEILPTGVVGTVSTTGSSNSWAVSPDGTRTALFGRTNFNTTRIALVDNQTGTRIGGILELSGGVAGTQFTSDRMVVTTTSEEGAVTRVAIVDLQTGAQVGDTVSVAGISDGPVGGGARLDASGTRAVLGVISPTGQAVSVAIIDVGTGQQLGSTLTIGGEAGGYPRLDPTGTRIVVTATDGENNLTRVAVLDTATGQQIGTTITVVGYQSQDVEPEEGSEGRSALAFDADGTRAILVTRAATGPQVLRVSVIDLATGAQIGSSIAVAGDTEAPLLVGDGRAVLTSYPSTGPGARLTVIDTAAGVQVGATLALSDDLGDVRFAAGGTRITVVTSSGSATQVVVLDSATGAQSGVPLSLSGGLYGPARLVADGDRLVVTTSGSGSALRIAVVDTTAGSQVGTTVAFSGQFSEMAFNADGSRATVAMVSGGVTTVSVVDTVAGVVLGAPVDISGQLRSIQLTDNGTRALVTLSAGADTQIAVIDVVTGIQLGATTTIAGAPSYSPAGVISADGTRAVVNTLSAGSTRSAVIDLTAGALVADGVILDGLPESGPGALFSPDGTRVAIFTMQFLPSGDRISRAAVLDTATGAQIGDTIVLDGYTTGESIAFNADGTVLLVNAGSYNSPTDSYTNRIVVVRTADGSQVGDTLVFDSVGQVRFNSAGDRAVVVTERDGTVAVTSIAV